MNKAQHLLFQLPGHVSQLPCVHGYMDASASHTHTHTHGTRLVAACARVRYPGRDYIAVLYTCCLLACLLDCLLLVVSKHHSPAACDCGCYRHEAHMSGVCPNKGNQRLKSKKAKKRSRRCRQTGQADSPFSLPHTDDPSMIPSLTVVINTHPTTHGLPSSLHCPLP